MLIIVSPSVALLLTIIISCHTAAFNVEFVPICYKAKDANTGAILAGKLLELQAANHGFEDGEIHFVADRFSRTSHWGPKLFDMLNLDDPNREGRHKVVVVMEKASVGSHSQDKHFLLIYSTDQNISPRDVSREKELNVTPFDAGNLSFDRNDGIIERIGEEQMFIVRTFGESQKVPRGGKFRV